MPNRFTAKLDALATYEEYIPPGHSLAKQIPELDKLDIMGYYQYLRYYDHRVDWRLRALFWAFIAELSDQDLEECFPEFFPSSPSFKKA